MYRHAFGTLPTLSSFRKTVKLGSKIAFETIRIIPAMLVGSSISRNWARTDKGSNWKL